MSSTVASPSDALKRPASETFAPMLLQIAKAPFVRDGWSFEPKLDGMRCLAVVREGNASLFSKTGRLISDTFPQLARELQCQPPGVYDGEIVAFNAVGGISFERLQERWSLRRAVEIEHADRTNRVAFFAFDVLRAGDTMLLRTPLCERREILSRRLQPSQSVQRVESFSDGIALFEACRAQKFEGIVAKRDSSFYRCGERTSDWQKIKFSRRDVFAIVGHKEGEGFVLARDDEIVGTMKFGFTTAHREFLASTLVAAREETIKRKRILWFANPIQVEVEFMEWTNRGLLRFPIFRAFV